MKIQTKIKFQSFGKTKPMTDTLKKRRMENKRISASRLADEEGQMKEILNKQNEAIEEAINKIKSGKFGRQVSVFKMKEIIGGSKKPKQEAHAVFDSKTGEKVVSVEEIKRVNLEHCIEVLRPNTPTAKAEELIKSEAEMHKSVMEHNTDSETKVTREDFDMVLEKLKDRNKRSYDFPIRAGEECQDSIYMFCKRMIEEECFPARFAETILYNLWKRKGSREDLNNHRYIHLKDWLPRLVESLCADMMKDDIFQGGTKYQIGGVPGHRMEEHLLTLRCITGRYISKGAGVILQLVDIKKFFDKERLGTVMTSLNKVNVNKKAYRCWYKLNQKTVFRVATPAGTTESSEATDSVPQGSGGAARASGLDIALGLQEQFAGSTEEVQFGKVSCNPQAFQDDIARLGESINSTNYGNIKISQMLEL